MPALFIRMSSFPNSAMVAWRIGPGEERTSPTIVRMGVLYLEVISDARLSRSGAVRASFKNQQHVFCGNDS